MKQWIQRIAGLGHEIKLFFVNEVCVNVKFILSHDVAVIQWITSCNK